jgi:hypothetical protein
MLKAMATGCLPPFATLDEAAHLGLLIGSIESLDKGQKSEISRSYSRYRWDILATAKELANNRKFLSSNHKRQHVQRTNRGAES